MPLNNNEIKNNRLYNQTVRTYENTLYYTVHNNNNNIIIRLRAIIFLKLGCSMHRDMTGKRPTDSCFSLQTPTTAEEGSQRAHGEYRYSGIQVVAGYFIFCALKVHSLPSVDSTTRSISVITVARLILRDIYSSFTVGRPG